MNLWETSIWEYKNMTTCDTEQLNSPWIAIKDQMKCKFLTNVVFPDYESTEARIMYSENGREGFHRKRRYQPLHSQTCGSNVSLESLQRKFRKG